MRGAKRGVVPIEEAGVALFLNSFTNKVDKKGRVSVPSTFRAAVEGSAYHGVVLFPHFSDPCLEGADRAYFASIADSLTSQYGPFSDAPNDLATAVLGGAVELPFDPEGRVTLPQSVRDHAGIDGLAVFVGMGPRFRIWSPAKFEDFQKAARERAAQTAAKMGPVGAPGIGGRS